MTDTTFRQDMIPIAVDVDSIRGDLDAAPTRVDIITRTWSEGQRGKGDPTESILYLGRGDDPPCIPVRHVSTREIASSGGRYEEGDIRIGPIRPQGFDDIDQVFVGFTQSQLNPPIDQEGIEVIYRLTPTDDSGTGICGDYALVEFKRDRFLRFELIVGRDRRTP